MSDDASEDLSRLNVKDDAGRPNPPENAEVPLTDEGKIQPAGGKPGTKTELAKKYRSSAHKGNARGLGKHEKEVQDNFTLMQGFEWYSEGGGVYWKQMKEKAKLLGEMGITAVWLPPPTKASSQEGNGYDIYDIWDLGEFDVKGGVATKWGTKQDYLDCVAELKKHGVVAYVDAVLNHKAGADFSETFHATEMDSNDRNKAISDCYEIEGWTGFNFPGRKGDDGKLKYSEMEWHHEHFTGVDYDAKNEKTSIFMIQGDNKGWAKSVDGENGNFDYLMFADIDHAHPEARDDIIKWGSWVQKESGSEGFRFDAIKHIDSGFISEFVQQVREDLGNPDLFCVGEFWKDSLDDLHKYLDAMGDQFSIFDTPLHYQFKEASAAGPNFDLRTIFDGSLVQSRPMDAVTLVDNHDTQPQQALESWVDPTFKTIAYALILWRNDGYPCVFAGDLWGCKSDPPVEPMSQLSDFVKIRKNFTYGPTRDYWDHPQTLGWVREGDAEHEGCAVVVSIGTEEGTKRMQLPDGHAGEKWIDVLGWSQGEVEIGEDGWAEFRCPAHSVSCWVNKDSKCLAADFKKD